MKQTYSTRERLRQFIILLLPILVTQLGIFSMSFFDTVMSGHASANDLAGVAIGVNLWMPLFTGINGVLLAITPIVAHLMGAGRKEKVASTVIQGVYLSVAITALVIVAGVFVVTPLLDAMKLEPVVHDIAGRYLIGISFGILPLLMYTVLRSFMDALGQTRITMLITLVSLPINVALNYVLIYGKLGFPRLGGVGTGYATAVTEWVIFLLALYVVRRLPQFASYEVGKRLYRVSVSAWVEQLKLGLPIGFAIFFEVSIFSAVTLLMSRFGTITIAAHQAAINFASFLYMVPMSIASALTIVVGFEVGAKRYQDARSYSRLGLTFAVGMAFVCALGIWLFNRQVAALYTTDAAVFVLAQQFLMYAIFFQLSDALATPIQGVLRGYKDVTVPSVIAFAAYWVIGLPLGYALANYTDLQAFGYWIGLIVGLTCGASCFLLRLRFIQRREATRIATNENV
ncbi:MATE family efflux transporter [Aneurinibacillus uraniidurans]|uniref:MATE family efflux transporter n=1 Tax=Aneurinibacillus uraniidurans TaxID=2966586 RepID=UPI002349E6BA|nr:MATE family efflux transporter [Aneurinibacillus sp. B1]WCN36880.1 MATE family efflux transporter [Aneurinibacillus sp. B1]